MNESSEFNWIDDCFRVEQKKIGLWYSYDKEGKGLITALTEDNCISGTRFYLKGLQDNWSGVEYSQHEGTVGGKL